MNKLSKSLRIAGNAYAEFVVVAGVLVPAVIAIPTLGKLADVNHTSVQANRYVMWEKTVYDNDSKNVEKLTAEVNDRFMMDPDALLQSGTREEGDELDENHLWAGLNRKEEGETNEPDENRVELTLFNEHVPSALKAKYFSEAMTALGNTLDGAISDAEWDLDSKGFYEVSLETKIGTNLFTSEELNCARPTGAEATDNDTDVASTCIRVLGAIFTDEWHAGSARQVERRVRSMVPGGAAEKVTNMLSVIGAIPLFKELKHLKGAFGTVMPDVLPEDRYGNEKP